MSIPHVLEEKDELFSTKVTTVFRVGVRAPLGSLGAEAPCVTVVSVSKAPAPGSWLSTIVFHLKLS